MIQRQPVKEGGKLFFCVLGEHLVDSGQVALLRTAGGVQIHIEDQALEQVGLTIIPEVVALALSMLIKEILGSECHFMRARKKIYSKS